MKVAGDAGLGALADYYRSPAVRARIAEYCGGSAADGRTFTATALAAYGGVHHVRGPEGAPVDLPLSAWPSILEDGADVCRSLADRTGTLLVFDIDYVNQGDPAEPYRDPLRTFERLEPVYAATLDVLESHAVRPLVLMTGRGYHVVVKAVWGSPLEAALMDIGAARPEAPRAREAEHRTHDGAGRLLEHLAHEVVRAVGGRAEVPISVLDIPPCGGGPFVCLDITAYGDPLAVRNTRCAFSLNQKARAQGLDVRPDVVAVLPRTAQPLPEMLRARADLGLAAEWAETADAAIPLLSAHQPWIGTYRAGTLARFHRSFDEMPPPSESGKRHDVDLAVLPACAAFPLSLPNAALVTPGWLRTVALVLWAKGWHPQTVVALVMERYGGGEEGWGNYWERYDRETRAAFYVRVCCGAVAGDIEGWDGFTCDDQRGRGFCPGPRPGCGVDLRQLGPTTRRGMP